MQKKKINKQIIDYLKKCNINYDKDNDIIYMNGNKINEYIKKILIERIKTQFKETFTIEEIKEILSDESNF